MTQTITSNNEEMISIPKSEYKRLKALDKVDWELVEGFKKSLKNLKEGKFVEC